MVEYVPLRPSSRRCGMPATGPEPDIRSLRPTTAARRPISVIRSIRRQSRKLPFVHPANHGLLDG